MTLRQTIQAAPTKVNELITKLSETSNQAVKTRESLLQDLSDDLLQQVDLEESHLLPILQKQSGTRQLAATAREGNKELRAKLAELKSTPADGDAFLGKLNELKKSFQAHVHGDRNELLPAVLKVLSDEEASALAATFDTATADLETAKREAKRDEAAQARRHAQQDEVAKEEQRAAARAGKAAEQATCQSIDNAAETVRQSSDALEAGVRRAGADVANKAENAAAMVRDAAATYRETSQEVLNGLGAVSASTSGGFAVAADMGSAWLGLTRKVMDLNREAVQRMSRVHSLAQLAEVQKDYVSGSLRMVMEGSTEVLQITQRASKQALGPLQARLGEAA